MMEKHFVEFYSPGTFVAETACKEIDSWDVDEAVKMAAGITERYNATPFAFRFLTRSRGPDDLDSKVTHKSVYYFLGGKVETYGDVVARGDPDEDMLRFNMDANRIKAVVVNTNSWKWTQELREGDVVLDYQQ